MRNRVTGAAAALTAAARAQTLAELRAHLTALTFGSPYLSAAEQLRANHHAHECENPAQLRRWLANTRAELARRALAEQHGTTVSDTLASSRDQQAATFFQPADSLTFAALVSQFIPQSNA